MVATNTVTAALADWREQTRFLVVAATLAAAVIALILFLIIRQITRQNREAQQRLEAERGRLDTALNNMIQGLVTFDASARLVTFNQRYIDMYNLSADVVKPGCHFRDLMQHRKDRGSFDGDVDEFCSSVVRNIGREQSSHSIIQCRRRAYALDRRASRWRTAAGSPPWKTSPNGAISNRSATATTLS